MKPKILILFMAAVFASTGPARGKIHLKIDSIPGNSADPKRKDWIDVSGFGIGVRTPVGEIKSGSPIPGSPELTPLRITAPTSAASPHLFAGVVRREKFPSAELQIALEGSALGAFDLAYWRLKDLHIISYETTATSDESSTTVTEAFELLPLTEVTYGYSSYDNTGTLRGNAEFHWNLNTGQVSTTMSGTLTSFQFVTGDVNIDDLPYFPVAADPSGPLVGDFNQDGSVDAADYVVWRKNGGSALEYQAWQGNFGATAGGSSSTAENTLVPEPTAGMLLVLGSVLLHFRAGRDRRLHRG